MLNLMSWLLVIFSKEQGKHVRTLGVRGRESAFDRAASTMNGARIEPQIRPKASSLHTTSFEDAVQHSFRKAKRQVSQRSAKLS